MTFDFAPEWMSSLLLDHSLTPLRSERELSVCAQSTPVHPCDAEVAALVSELFAEGTLSPEQLYTLAGLPELKPHLDHALAGLAAPRRNHT